MDYQLVRGCKYIIEVIEQSDMPYLKEITIDFSWRSDGSFIQYLSVCNDHFPHMTNIELAFRIVIYVKANVGKL